ncbi:Aste57867_12987 [Aphanomyces stellatus]|uniref:Aste57867_12987 protein n=1 Tax=Aphanomyces stellatus TaxID=120398 RepID=A0A485KYM3_9STRA|nr:hypothetical protein As57867_012939 [Aphanomyces stellatus]VFT89833.1 Aste57867_12987 [Aphanomyces stellatus]
MGLLEDYYREVMGHENRIRPVGRRQTKKPQPPKRLDKLEVARPQTHVKTKRQPTVVVKPRSTTAQQKHRVVGSSIATAVGSRPRNNQDEDDKVVQFKLAWREHVEKEKPALARHVSVTPTKPGGLAALVMDDATHAFFPLQLLQQVHVNINMWTLLATDETFFKIAAHNARLRKLQENQLAKGSLNPAEWALQIKFQKQTSTLNVKGETRSIVANGAEQLTDAGLMAVAKAVVALECLEIASARHVTDAAMRTLALNCGNLTSLNIAGCSGIAGAGLGAVSDHCHKMTRLSLAECHHLEEWVLVRAFYNFQHLTHLNLSACSQVTDNTIKTMAFQCRHLASLDLSFCSQVTDTGVVFLAQHCRGLVRLNVATSKTRFNERITDLSLLSLGEHCPSLEMLNVFGCTFVSDVGVQWLVQGCRVLTQVDLTHCYKLTDAAMRSFGSCTTQLQVLHLGHAKNVSDVGLRFLSDGCPRLTLLHLNHLYLISDGVKREFGLEGLQAVAQSCRALTDLDLSGCFQLVERSLKCLAGNCSSLTKLNLKGCVKATPAGLASILQGCLALVHLNLTAVEQCNNAVLQDIARSPALRELILAHCDRINDSGIRQEDSLALSVSFTALSLLGCKLVTDFGMCAFVAAFRTTTPALLHLILDGCPLITEDFLNRAALACPLLLRLSIHGCGVSTRVLSSLKTSWKYTVFRSSQAETGYFPAHRAKERRHMDESGQLCLAAVKIQNVYRLRKANQEFARQRDDAMRNRVVRRLQSRWRGRRDRQRTFILWLANNKKHSAAKSIQRCFRKYRTKQRAMQQFEDLWLKRTEEMALFVQRRYRAVRLSRVAKVARLALQRWTKKRHEAATKMQRRWRGIDGRRRFQLAKASRAAQMEEEKASASQLQALIRGRQARKVAAARRQAELELEQARHAAAIRLQCMYRQRIARKKFHARIARLAEMTRAVTKMQSAWRARQGRNFMGAMRMAKERRDQDVAATYLQQQWRKRQAYVNRVWESELRRNRNVARLAATRRLQLWWRNELAILAARAQMRLLLEMKHRDEAMLFWAVQLVQTHYRTHRARACLARLKAENESRWKQVLDNDNAYGRGAGAPFYYVRAPHSTKWMAPSGGVCRGKSSPGNRVLNAINVVELVGAATVECSWCCEYFCDECWVRVHGHGKRQEHVMRKLFNFYMNRIDYGDGDFPSVWPSEIEQDRKRPWDFINFVPLAGYDDLVAWIAAEDMRLYLLKHPPPPPVDEPVVEEVPVVVVVEEAPKPRAFDEDSHGNKVVFKPVGYKDEDVAPPYQVKVDVYAIDKTKKSKRKKRPLATKKKMLHAAAVTAEKSTPIANEVSNEAAFAASKDEAGVD